MVEEIADNDLLSLIKVGTTFKVFNEIENFMKRAGEQFYHPLRFLERRTIASYNKVGVMLYTKNQN